MADINITKEHALDAAAAKSKLEDFGVKLQKEYGIKSSWNGNVCSLSGTGLKKGTVEINDSSVTIEITLGLLGKALKSTIEKKINSEFGKVLG